MKRYTSVTMTKIKNKTIDGDIQTNIKDVKKIYVPSSVFMDLDVTFEFLKNNLPRYYANQVLKILPKDKKVDIAYIRRVKTYKILNVHIITAMYRVAQFHAIQKSETI